MVVSSQRRWLDYIAILLVLGFIAIYIVSVFPHLNNIPKANDDLKIYLFHFYLYLENSDILGLLNYLFTSNNNLHIKLDARIITFISYLIFGSINFKFILISGHLLYLSTLYFLRRFLSKLSDLEFLPVVVIFTMPSYSCASWSVAVWGYYSQMFFIVWIAYLVYNSKTKSAIATCVFNTFTLATGFLSFLTGLFYLAYKRNYCEQTKNRTIVYWLLSFSISVCALFFLLSGKINDGTNDVESNFNLLSFSNYLVVFLLNSLSEVIPETLKLTIIAYLLLTLTTVSVIIYIAKRRQGSDPQFILLIIIIIILVGHGFASSFFRYNPELIIQSVPMRYELFSIVFISLFTALLVYITKELLPSRLKQLFLITLICLSSILSCKKHTVAKIGFERFDELIANKLINSLVENKASKKQYYINNYVEKGLYSPPVEYLRNDNFKVINNSLSSTPVMDSSSQVQILSFLKSDHFILLEFYTLRPFRAFNLIVNDKYKSEVKRYKVNRLANFKTFKKTIPKSIYNKEFGYQIQFPYTFNTGKTAVEFKLFAYDMDNNEFIISLNK